MGVRPLNPVGGEKPIVVRERMTSGPPDFGDEMKTVVGGTVPTHPRRCCGQWLMMAMPHYPPAGAARVRSDVAYANRVLFLVPVSPFEREVLAIDSAAPSWQGGPG